MHLKGNITLDRKDRLQSCSQSAISTHAEIHPDLPELLSIQTRPSLPSAWHSRLAPPTTALRLMPATASTVAHELCLEGHVCGGFSALLLNGGNSLGWFSQTLSRRNVQQVSSLGLLRHKLRSCLFRMTTAPSCQKLHCALWGVQPLFIRLFCWPGAHTVLCSHCFATPMTGCRVNQTVTSDSLIHQFYSYLFVVFGWYDQAPQSRCCEPCVLLQSDKLLPDPGDT